MTNGVTYDDNETDEDELEGKESLEKFAELIKENWVIWVMILLMSIMFYYSSKEVHTCVNFYEQYIKNCTCLVIP